ncbi:hypothetical protein ACI77O_13270 [Pseudomonas tritici]|uniref:hypothetical protein n=1 Tax=Pseudomonas tritici TaxID=2745518 RepID=UPI00387AB731
MTANLGDEPVVQTVDPQEPVAADVGQPEPQFVVGKTASELGVVFKSQSNAISADPSLKFVRNVHYTQVECDIELQFIPLDALSLGLTVKADASDPSALCEHFIFSLLLATGTLNRAFIDVGPDCDVDPQIVLEEAEAHGLNVRLMLPESPTTIDSVRAYVERLEAYSVLWLAMGSGNFSLTPLDGYLEYKFSVAVGHTPKEITTNLEMKMLFTDDVPMEVMDFIKDRLDVVIDRVLGGDEYFVGEVKKLAGALALKDAELREARIRMLEEELDARTPVPNLIRSASKMSGLSIVDAAGMIYELKNSIHAVLDKYLPKGEGEDATAFTPSAAQMEFAKNLVGVLGSAFGGQDGLIAAWNGLSEKTQLSKVIDLDRGAVEPSEAAKLAADTLGVDGKVAALAMAEFTGIFGSILRAGGAISEIGLEKPKPVNEPTPPAPSGLIIAVG